MKFGGASEMKKDETVYFKKRSYMTQKTIEQD